MAGEKNFSVAIDGFFFFCRPCRAGYRARVFPEACAVFPLTGRPESSLALVNLFSLDGGKEKPLKSGGSPQTGRDPRMRVPPPPRTYNTGREKGPENRGNYTNNVKMPKMAMWVVFCVFLVGVPWQRVANLQT